MLQQGESTQISRKQDLRQGVLKECSQEDQWIIMEAIIVGGQILDGCLYFGAGSHHTQVSCFSTPNNDNLFFSSFFCNRSKFLI